MRRPSLLLLLLLAGVAVTLTACTRLTGPSSPPDARTLVGADDPQRGNANAFVTIVEFSDFQCPGCAAAETILPGVLAQYPATAVRFVYRDFPLRNLHQYAQAAAEAAQCAHQQGNEFFWPYHDLLFTKQPSFTPADLLAYAERVRVGARTLDSNAFRNCVESQRTQAEVNADFDAGRAAGVTATPTFFINDEKMVGLPPNPAVALKQLIDRKIAEARATQKQ